MDLKIENAKYFKAPDESEASTIICTINGEYWGVPIHVGNAHYDEIKKQIDAGTLTVEEADK